MNGTPRTYAIGDIHGHLDRLCEVHGWIARDRDNASDVVVHIGDLTDRGPDGAGVIQFVIEGLTQGKPWVVLKGNHDRLCARYLESPMRPDPRFHSSLSWVHPRLGGLTTLASYGVDVENLAGEALLRAARAAVPNQHRAFLAELDTFYRTDEVLFVHAGIKPGVAIEDQSEDDLIWIREPFLSDTRDHGPLIIHGHTPIDIPTHYGNRVNIDSGVAFGGPLSVIVVEGRQVWNLTAAGRVPMLPVTRR